jgi:hypothetical protein
MYTERAEAFFPLRAMTTAADTKRDARAASDKCADRMKGMQSGGDLKFTLLPSGCITDASSHSFLMSPLARGKAPVAHLVSSMRGGPRATSSSVDG